MFKTYRRKYISQRKVFLIDFATTVGIQLSDMSGNWMVISSPVTEWFVIQVTIQLPN